MVDIYKSIIPFVALNGILLALLIVYPEICLWLPRVVFGG
jgi:TRAP-type mannitol/chloroaromatic compound transport system permease large subunit